MPQHALYLDEPFTSEINSKQCLEFSAHLREILRSYLRGTWAVKDGRFQINPGAIGTVGQVMSLSGDAVKLPLVSHVLKALGAGLAVVDVKRAKGLAEKLYQKIGGHRPKEVEDYIESVVRRLTRQYQSQLEQLVPLEEGNTARPMKTMVDWKEKCKDIAGIAKDALLNNNVAIPVAQLVAEFAAVRIIEYMESHCDENKSSPFLMVPMNPTRAVSDPDTLYVAIHQNRLSYQLLHPNGQIIEDEITQEELGCSLNEHVAISELNNHAMPTIMAVLRDRGHISPINPTLRWSPSELVAAVQSYHGIAASVNSLVDKVEDRVYGKLTVIVNQQNQKKAWLITDLFSRPGLCVENPLMLTKTYYHDDATGRTNTKDYGYRLSTQEEAIYLRYPVIQQTHYAPSVIRDYIVAQLHASHLSELDKSLVKQDTLDAHFTNVKKTPDAQKDLFQHVLEVNSAYSNQSHTAALLQQIKDNYFLFLQKAEDTLNAEPDFAIFVYTQMALSFTTLNDPHTAWACYCKAAALIEPTSPFKNELQLGRLRCEYQNAVQYIQLLGQSFQQQLALESFKTRITTVRTIEDEQQLLLETAPLWKAHVPNGLEAIKEYYIFSPNQPRLTQWLANNITHMMRLYKTTPDQGFDIGMRLASAYLNIGRMRTVNEIYQSLEPMLSARFNLYMTQLEDAQRSGNISAFNDITFRLCRPLLQRYQGHQQWERGRKLIYAIAQKAKRLETFELDLLTSGTSFTINGVGEVSTPDTLLPKIQTGASLPLDTCIQSLKQAPTARDKELVWMKLLQEVLTRQVDYLGEPPCAFSFLYLKPFKTPSTEHLTFRLLLEKSVTALMPMEMMYFNTLLRAVRDVIDNVEGKWSIKNINNKDQLVREGMHIDRRCYIQELHVQWSTSHVHTPIELMNTMVEQWGKDKLHQDAIVTPVPMYTSDNGASLLNDYASDFFAHHPALYITSQCIDSVPSPLTIQNQNGTFYLSPSVTSALLQQTRTILQPKPKTDGQAGNHMVLPIWTKAKNNLETPPDYYVKRWPENPGRSYACAHLAERLCGGGVVHSVAHLLTYTAPHETPKHFCVELIETAKGRALVDWMYPTERATNRLLPDVQEQNLQVLNCLSATEFTKHILLSICFHLEDESPENIFFDAATYTLTKIDVERAFLGQIKKPKDSKDNKGLTVKSILFCMDNMLDYLDEATIRHFVSLDMFHEVEQWLGDLEKENTRHRDIFMRHIGTLYQPFITDFLGRKTPNIDSSLLGVVFPDSLLPDLLERLLALQNELRLSLCHHEPLTGLDLLRCVSANVYSYYKQLFEETRWSSNPSSPKNQHAFARFKYITDGLYRRNTLISCKTSVEIEGEYHLGEIANILHGRQDCPTTARESLKQYKNVTEDAALAALREGRPFLFRWLREDKQASVLQQLTDRPETTRLTIDAQRTILNTLAIFPLRSLTLTPFAAVLDDDMLKRVVQDTGHHVQNLNVANCHLLTQESLYIIAEYCLNLQILDMSGIKSLLEIVDKPSTFGGQKLQFTHCRMLILNGSGIKQILCPNTSQFPELRHVEIKGCEALERAEINTASVLTIDGLDSCLKLLGRATLLQYPWLVGLSLATGLTEGDYQQIAQAMSDAFTKYSRLQRLSPTIKRETLDYLNQLYRHINQLIIGAVSNLNAIHLPFTYWPGNDILLLGIIAKTRVTDRLISLLLTFLHKSIPNYRLFRVVAEALSELGVTNNNEVIRLLLQKLEDDCDYDDGRLVFATTLVNLGVTNNHVVNRTLLHWVRNRVCSDYKSYRELISAFVAIGKLSVHKNPEVVDTLLHGLKHERSKVREASATALVKLAISIPLEFIEELLQGMKNSLNEVRKTSARALGALGISDNPKIIDALLHEVHEYNYSGYHDGGYYVCLESAIALFKLGVSNKSIIFYISDASRNSICAHMRQTSCEALGGNHERANDPNVIRALLGGMSDEEWFVRQASAEALVKLNFHNSPNNQKDVQDLLKGVRVYSDVFRLNKRTDFTCHAFRSALVKLGATGNLEIVQTLLHGDHGYSINSEEGVRLVGELLSPNKKYINTLIQNNTIAAGPVQQLRSIQSIPSSSRFFTMPTQKISLTTGLGSNGTANPLKGSDVLNGSN